MNREDGVMIEEEIQKSLSTDPKDRSKKIFVGNLTPKTTPAQLKQHLGSSGLEVLNAKVLRRSDGSSKCCGIVEFKSPKDVLKAIHLFHGSSLDGRNILVKPDEPESLRGYYKRQPKEAVDPETTLFVTNIGVHVQESQLRDLFSTAGDLGTLKFYFSPSDGKPLGKAMLQYRDRESAANAILKFNGYLFERRYLHVRFCNPL